jgi:NADH-quinone oxidoreductase subunit C
MAQFNNEHILTELNSQFEDKILDVQEPYGMLTIEIEPNTLLEMVQFLYNHKSLQFTFLTSVCGLHTPNQVGKELGTVYHLHSLINNLRLRIKCFMPLAEPNVPSLTPIFETANWQERETYDFYGINFEGHPNLIRILNVEEMEYFPMRKEYPLEDQARTDKDDKYFGR